MRCCRRTGWAQRLLSCCSTPASAVPTLQPRLSPPCTFLCHLVSARASPCVTPCTTLWPPLHQGVSSPVLKCRRLRPKQNNVLSFDHVQLLRCVKNWASWSFPHIYRLANLPCSSGATDPGQVLTACVALQDEPRPTNGRQLGAAARGSARTGGGPPAGCGFQPSHFVPQRRRPPVLLHAPRPPGKPCAAACARTALSLIYNTLSSCCAKLHVPPSLGLLHRVYTADSVFRTVNDG